MPKLQNDTSKVARRLVHKRKMEWKARRRAMWHIEGNAHRRVQNALELGLRSRESFTMGGYRVSAFRIPSLSAGV